MDIFCTLFDSCICCCACLGIQQEMQTVHPQKDSVAGAEKDTGDSTIISSPLTVRQEGSVETWVDSRGISQVDSRGISQVDSGRIYESPQPPVESLRISTPKD